MSEQTTQEQIVEMDINLLRTFKDHPFKVAADYPMIQLKERELSRSSAKKDSTAQSRFRDT